MLFKIKRNSHANLNEVGQINAIRWQILKELGEGEFETQSQVMKCTDYFNDVVAKKVAGTNFGVYGFDNTNIKFEADGGLFVEVTNLKDNFLDNLAIINEQLRKDLSCEVEFCKDDRAATLILHFPDAVLRSTYRVSLLCWVLRLSNYGVVFNKWEDIWTNLASPANTTEVHLKGPKVAPYAHKWGFKVQDKFQQYWWFSGAAFNSEKDPLAKGTIVHNCGCASWCNSMAL